jgi:hypothetical protein
MDNRNRNDMNKDKDMNRKNSKDIGTVESGSDSSFGKDRSSSDSGWQSSESDRSNRSNLGEQGNKKRDEH